MPIDPTKTPTADAILADGLRFLDSRVGGPPLIGEPATHCLLAEIAVQLRRVADALHEANRSGIGIKNGTTDFPEHVVVDEPAKG